MTHGPECNGEPHARPDQHKERDSVFPHLADRLDEVGEEMREVFLVKAFLLLADAHGDMRTVLDCLEEAATSGHAPRRGGDAL